LARCKSQLPKLLAASFFDGINSIEGFRTAERAIVCGCGRCLPQTVSYLTFQAI
jgi:hypothetical protein